MAGRHPEGSHTLSVTHINSSMAEDSNKPVVSITSLVDKLASGENAPQKIDGFARNPVLVEQEAAAMQLELERAHASLRSSASATSEAERIKGAANACFSAGNSHVALVGYATALWLLSKASCPKLISHALASGTVDEISGRPEVFDGRLTELSSWLQAGGKAMAAAASSDAAQGSADSQQLLVLSKSLHLNLAAAALKLSAYALAKSACEVVLSVDSANGKALFRLARAHEGAGDVGSALSTAVSACKAEPQNGEARKLFEALRKRRQEEKAQFAGKVNMFSASASEGGSGGGGGSSSMVWSAATLS